jgi:uncharacterized protein (TIGR02246 family)
MNWQSVLVMQACCVWFVLSDPISAMAQVSGPRNNDAEAIRDTEKAYLAAVRHGDAEAIRKYWTPQGDYVDASGRRFKLHDLKNQQNSQRQPDGEIAEIPLPDSTLRFIGPDVAIEDGITELGMSPDGEQLAGRFSAVWVKRDGKWLLDCLRESIIESPAQSEHLKPLEWLLGEWAGTTDDAVVLVSSYWGEGGNYILRDFAVRRDGGELANGTERIGWDAAAGEWVSWTFDSQGGRGQGRWRPDGERWLVDITDLLPDGKRAATSAVYTPVDDDHFVWEVRQADLAGEKLAPVRIQFQRAVEDR